MVSLQQTKRSLKAIRNGLVDPWPRNRSLALESISIDPSGIDFYYQALERTFRIRATLPSLLAAGMPGLPAASRDQLLTALGIAFAPFLFKLSDFARLDVRTTPLDDESIAFFEHFLVHGLGEFRYLQGLNPLRPIRVQAIPPARPAQPAAVPADDRVLLLNGGGKDTIVAAELLKACGQPFTWFTVRPNVTRRRVIELSGVTEAIEVGYHLDEALHRLRRYPWGHMPHTSIVLCFAVLVALLTGHRYVAVGNEHSSSHSNLRFRGMEVNHQFTKSYAFERGFASFVRRNVSPSIDVFSVLRPFHDLQLTQLFAGQRKYFPHFLSCNRGMHSGTWCKRCPKCAFTALTLHAFLSKDDLLAVFRDDPILRPEIRRHIVDLVSATIKPWECVGTQEESALALRMLLDRNPSLEFDASPSRSQLWRLVAGLDVASMRSRYLEKTQAHHAIPPGLLARLNEGLARISAGFRVSGQADTG